MSTSPPLEKTDPPNGRPVLFLLGAGASAEAGVPLMEQMVDEFSQTLTAGRREEFEQLRLDLRPIATEGVVDLELVLAALDVMTAGRDANLAAIAFDVPAPTNPRRREALEGVGHQMRQFVRRRCTEDIVPERTVYLDPLLNFARQAGTLDVYTLNYDVTIETLAERERVDWTDGFEMAWDRMALGTAQGSKARPLIRLIKLHGSVTWYQRSDFRYVRLPIVPVSDLEYFTHEPLSEIMVYPAVGKAPQASVYTELADLFRQNARTASVLVIIGYSLRDPHVMELLDEAIAVNRDLFVIVVDRHANTLREKLLTTRRIPERCLANESDAGEALKADRLLNLVNSVTEAQGYLASAKASKPERFETAKTEYRKAILLYRNIEHADGIRAIVASDESSNPNPSGYSERVHLLADLPACIWFALTTPEDRFNWWRMTASLIHWWESNTQERTQRSFRDHRAPEGTSPGNFDVSASRANLALEVMRAALGDNAERSDARHFLTVLADQVALLRDALNVELLQAVTDETLDLYRESPGCASAMGLAHCGPVDAPDLAAFMPRVLRADF